MNALPTTLVEMLRRRAQSDPDTLAFTFLIDGEEPGARLSYGEIDRKACAIAAALAERGVRAGDRALLLYPPGLDFIPAFFGCLYAGVIAVPAYPPPPNPAQLGRALLRLLAIIGDADVSIVLTESSVAAGAGAIAHHAPILRHLQWLSTDTLPGAGRAFDVEPTVTGETLALLQYTSGSTAAPKGVMISHANLLHNLGYVHHLARPDEQTVSVSWTPVIHDMGLIQGVLQPAYSGYPAYLMAPTAFLQRPVRWLRAITRYRATTSGGPNFAYDLCVRKIGDAELQDLDLTSWCIAYSGAEPVRRDTLVAFHERFHSSGFSWRSFCPVYGLAESTLVVSAGERDADPAFVDADAGELARGRVKARHPEGVERPRDRSPGAAVPRRGTVLLRVVQDDALWAQDDNLAMRTLVACGRPAFGTRALIVDPESLEPCADGVVGEIWVASPSVARGYWRRVEETAEIFGARLADGTGPFLRTGDLGILRDEQIIITGRLKDLLIVRGLKHYPQDIELTAERQHGALRPGCSAAFAVETNDGEGIVIALEVDTRHASGDPDALAAHLDAVIEAVRRGVAEHHGIALSAVSLLVPGTLPKTTSGKLRRRACRAAFASGRLEELARWTPALFELPMRALATMGV